MKLQKTPVILVAIAALLGGVVLLTNQKEAVREETVTKRDRLFDFQEADVQSFTVKTLTKSLAFERINSVGPAPSPAASPTSSPAPNAAASPFATLSSRWQMTVPKLAPANDGAIAFLLNLLATGKSQQSVKVSAARLAEFELDRPFATVAVKLQDQQTHRLTLGKTNFNNTGIYAQVDPPEKPTGDLTVVLVPLDFQNAVTRAESEWLPSPVAKEATPQNQSSPSPSPSPSSSPSSSPSPSPSPSPSLSVKPSVSPSASPSSSPLSSPSASPTNPKPTPTPAPGAPPSPSTAR